MLNLLSKIKLNFNPNPQPTTFFFTFSKIRFTKFEKFAVRKIKDVHGNMVAYQLINPFLS